MSRTDDRKAIRSLRVGVVPSSYVLQLTVGLNSQNSRIDEQISKLRTGDHAPLIISGEWGTGKSNLLSYLREYALAKNVAVAYINLNGRSTAINHPQRFYHRIATELRVPGIPGRGLANLLSHMRGTSLEKLSDAWLSSNRYQSEFGQALGHFMNGGYDWARQVLFGTDLAWADYNYKKVKAIGRLGQLGQYLKGIGFGGLMIQFDELETLAQLWNYASRRSAYRILNSLTSLEYVWSVFATTERLNYYLNSDKYRTSDYEALSFLDRYKDFPVMQPPMIDGFLAYELLKRIDKLYRSVYSFGKDPNLYQVADQWKRMSFNNPRRLIRLAIDRMDRNRPTPRPYAMGDVVGHNFEMYETKRNEVIIERKGGTCSGTLKVQKLAGQKTSAAPELTACPLCQVQVKQTRLNKHMAKVHSRNKNPASHSAPASKQNHKVHTSNLQKLAAMNARPNQKLNQSRKAGTNSCSKSNIKRCKFCGAPAIFGSDTCYSCS